MGSTPTGGTNFNLFIMNPIQFKVVHPADTYHEALGITEQELEQQSDVVANVFDKLGEEFTSPAQVMVYLSENLTQEGLLANLTNCIRLLYEGQDPMQQLMQALSEGQDPQE